MPTKMMVIWVAVTDAANSVACNPWRCVGRPPKPSATESLVGSVKQGSCEQSTLKVRAQRVNL